MTKNILEFSEADIRALESLRAKSTDYPFIDGDLVLAKQTVSDFLTEEKKLREQLNDLTCADFLAAGAVVKAALDRLRWLEVALPILKTIEDRQRTRRATLKNELDCELSSLGNQMRIRLHAALCDGRISAEDRDHLAQRADPSYYRGELGQRAVEMLDFVCGLAA